MSKTIIIQGSSRSTGDTYKYSQYLKNHINCDHLDLLDYNIGAFDYEFKNASDDFMPLIKNLITNYDQWIVTSPVYWYSMSGTMKNFLDRISDLLIKHKEWGRKLKGKNLACLSVSNSNDVSDSYYKPFIMSADYLGINYLGEYHAWGDSANISTEVKAGIEKLATTLKTS